MKPILLLSCLLVTMPAVALENDYGIDKETMTMMMSGNLGLMELARERMLRSRIVFERSLKCTEAFPDNAPKGKKRLSDKEIAIKLKALDKE